MVEKAWIASVSGDPVDSYLNYDINNDHSPNFTFMNGSDVISVFNPSDTLIPAPSGPGFYLLRNQLTNEDVIVELVQSIPFTVR